MEKSGTTAASLRRKIAGAKATLGPSEGVIGLSKIDKEALSTSPWVEFQLLDVGNWHMTDGDIEFLRGIGERRQYPKNACILCVGSHTQEMYFVVRGLISQVLLGANGIEKTVCILSHGCFLADEPFFHSQPILYNAVAVTDAEVLAIRKKYTEDLLRRPSLVHALLMSISLKSRILATQVEDLATRSAESRVCRLLYCLLANDDYKGSSERLALTHQELASLAGLHRVTVTKTITMLRKQGLVDVQRDGSIVVHDERAVHDRAFC